METKSFWFREVDIHFKRANVPSALFEFCEDPTICAVKTGTGTRSLWLYNTETMMDEIPLQHMIEPALKRIRSGSGSHEGGKLTFMAPLRRRDERTPEVARPLYEFEIFFLSIEEFNRFREAYSIVAGLNTRR